MPKPNDRKTKKVYNSIAEGFYHLRQQPITPEIKKLTEKWKVGKILDVGCSIGNSTLPFAKKGFDCFGLDFSHKMIQLAKKFSEKNNVQAKLSVGDMLFLPFKNSEFDYVISIAAFHHLDSVKKRLQALQEIKRVLENGGKIFLTVWNVPEIYGKERYISWRRKNKIYKRYYHFFSKEELKKLFEVSGFKEIKIFEDDRKKNICVLASK